ncbi:hypothetical protein [Luteococcus peritonei]|uniref:Uncharacterized protein n=1 Tax=Luteococcus peritonei TaxID=88874 RepID=A0ABW4RUC0_9ACTN
MPVNDGGDFVDQVEAIKAWGKAAQEVLVETAGTGSTIEYQAFARALQQRSGIHTKQPTSKWVGPLLGIVARQCQQQQVPLLTALVVRRDGTVGPAYDEILRFARIPAVIGDREEHAAEQRRAAHARWQGRVPVAQTAPADGTTPATGTARPRKATVVGKVPVTKASRSKPEPLQGNICPRCFMQMSLTGVCDNCD